MKGIQKVNQEERAFRAWNVLIDYATQKKIITYKILAEKLNVHHRTCKYFLELIQNYCLDEKLPPLTIIVHNQEGKIGQGFIAWDSSNMDEGIKKVFNFNWNNYPNPFSYASLGATEQELADKIYNKLELPTVVYAQVKVRGVAQRIFRQALLQAYNTKCAFCGFPHEAALEAAHIIPWSQCEDQDKLNINNGLLLCSNHHKLFDRGILQIDADYIIRATTNFNSKIIGKKLRLPRNKEHHPTKLFFHTRK